MTIGELAHRAALPASTIRYYEQMGLLPAPPRRNGWRQYDGDALAQLTVVQFALSCGFTLAETRQLVRGFSAQTPISERWRALARTKIAEMDAAVERARTMKNLLVRISRCQCETLEQCGRAMLRKRAQRST
jgi:MerR family transcriptional regulator, redox-sensitive transcriptional activator SoxR